MGFPSAYWSVFSEKQRLSFSTVSLTCCTPPSDGCYFALSEPARTSTPRWLSAWCPLASSSKCSRDGLRARTEFTSAADICPLALRPIVLRSRRSSLDRRNRIPDQADPLPIEGSRGGSAIRCDLRL
eukprot:9254985-Pyramimonas_sp.AAC.1